jgi:hypothetical protein
LCANVLKIFLNENEAEIGILYLVAELTYEKLTYTLCKQMLLQKVQRSGKKFYYRLEKLKNNGRILSTVLILHLFCNYFVIDIDNII